jgi:hypothetical protein
VQSVAWLHSLPTAHRAAHVVPPQSTSVSVPFVTVSVQVGAAQIAPEHTPLWQSLPLLHPAPFAHLPGQPPPQSTPVSVPFFTVSLHVGATHIMVAPHTPLVQSPLTTHRLPLSHLTGHVPPQSTSDSVPFFWLSVQLDA